MAETTATKPPMEARTTVVVAVSLARLGRRGELTETLTIKGPGDFGDLLAEAIFRFARKHLASKWFEVGVYDDGTGVVEGGRFGTFTWAVLS